MPREHIRIKTPAQIEGIRRACRLAARVLDHVEPYVKAGISTEELDHICNRFTLANGGKSACINYLGGNRWGKGGYSRYTCISRNDIVCHGMPSAGEFLVDGDIVNIDVTVIVDGYFGDTSRTFLVGEVSTEAKRLVESTKACLEA